MNSVLHALLTLVFIVCLPSLIKHLHNLLSVCPLLGYEPWEGKSYSSLVAHDQGLAHEQCRHLTNIY